MTTTDPAGFADATHAYWLTQKASEVPGHTTWLGPTELSVLSALHFPKRRDDWLLGRWTAKKALFACFQEAWKHVSQAQVEILAAADGAPEVFLFHHKIQVSISLSHSQGLGFCVVSPEGEALGCDIEKIEARSEAFIRDYFLPGEQNWVNQQAESGKALFANLIWSAKESAMKILREGLRIDTRRLEIRAEEQEPGWSRLSVRDREMEHIWPGFWRKFDNFVMTIVGAEEISQVMYQSLGG